MIYSQLLVSAILIACGFLVKRFPDLIAGYNTLSDSDKEKIDIDALSSYLKKVLIGLGLFCLFLLLILKLCDVRESHIMSINSTIIVVIILTASFRSNTRYKR